MKKQNHLIRVGELIAVCALVVDILSLLLGDGILLPVINETGSAFITETEAPTEAKAIFIPTYVPYEEVRKTPDEIEKQADEKDPVLALWELLGGTGR